MNLDDYPLLKAAGVGKTLKMPYKKAKEFLFGTKADKMIMSVLRDSAIKPSGRMTRQAKDLLSKYRTRQLLSALGVSGAASSPLVYKALDKSAA